MVGKLTTLSGGNGSNYPRCINLPGRIRVGGRRGRSIRLAVNFPPPLEFRSSEKVSAATRAGREKGWRRRRRRNEGERREGGEYYGSSVIIMSGIMSTDPISSGQRFRGIEKLLSTEGLTFNEIRQTLARIFSPSPSLPLSLSSSV